MAMYVICAIDLPDRQGRTHIHVVMVGNIAEDSAQG